MERILDSYEYSPEFETRVYLTEVPFAAIDWLEEYPSNDSFYIKWSLLQTGDPGYPTLTEFQFSNPTIATEFALRWA